MGTKRRRAPLTGHACPRACKLRRVLVTLGGPIGVALLVTSILLAGCSVDDQAEAQDGPLVFPSGYATILSPRDDAAFSTFEACAGDEPAPVLITAAEAVETVGADDAEIRVGWPTPQRPNKFGAGGLGDLPRLFKKLDSQGAVGQVGPCGQGAATLEFAVLLPAAAGGDVLVDGVVVEYEVEGEAYREEADVRVGACAPEPVAHQVSECSDSE